MTAGIGFWHSRDGQNLIKSFNGSISSTALGNWLATTFSNLYGAGAGANNLAGRTNAQVAAFFQSRFSWGLFNADIQVLATALNVYATTLSLSGTVACSYGFTVNATGLGACSYNTGLLGPLFGECFFATVNVYRLLREADDRACNGELYPNSLILRGLWALLFRGVNQSGCFC